MTERTKLIARFRSHLEERGWPRVVLFMIVAISGFAGFLVSFALLSAGMSSMAWRYGIAGGSAYVVFLSLLALYIVWKRRLGELDAGDALEAAQWIDLPVPGGGSPGPASYFTGGQSGGAGASSSWAAAPSSSSSSSGSGGGGGSWWFDDAETGWFVFALVALFAGAIAVGYVVWAAPALLAEVFVDALIVGTVSKQMGLTERRDWTATALRRTWFPATVLIVTLAIAGWALQQAAPEARSIGPAVQSILS